VIRFTDVSARYPRAADPTLRAVSLTAAAGELTAVVGPNGSGKSTLIRTLLGRVAVVGGGITVDGAALLALSRRDVARRVAIVIQREEPFFGIPVREYVSLGRHPHLGAWSASREDDPVVHRAFAAAGISDLAARTTDTLSGGEWQRVRIARALAQDTPALVLDEPTTFLDIAHEMETFELLARLAGDGRAVLVVSHQLNLVARFARHVVLLHGGRVISSGSPDEIMQAPILESIYHWPLVIARDPVVGAPTLVPLRRAAVRDPPPDSQPARNRPAPP
jgi:iron complex transport system ATP-binding protein